QQLVSSKRRRVSLPFPSPPAPTTTAQPATEQLTEDLIKVGVKPPPDSTHEILLVWHTTNCTNIVPPSTKLASVAQQQQQQQQLMDDFHDVLLPPSLTNGRTTATTTTSTMLNGSNGYMLQLEHVNWPIQRIHRTSPQYYQKIIQQQGQHRYRLQKEHQILIQKACILCSLHWELISQL
ncbi:unnamed protein product, partial [Didymodactylos carnosus]